MIDNPCLRPASLSDVPLYYLMERSSKELPGNEIRESLAVLYDAEWRKRGYRISP